MNVITKYKWRLLVLFARLLMVNIEAQKQDYGNLTENEILVQNLISDTINASLAKRVLDLSPMNGNKTIYM